MVVIAVVFVCVTNINVRSLASVLSSFPKVIGVAQSIQLYLETLLLEDESLATGFE